MPKDQYVIIQRQGKWWVTIDGVRTGPFNLRQEALDAAIGAAKTNEKTGRKSAVSWDDPDDGLPIVYDSEDR